MGKGNDTLHFTGLTDTDIAADDRPTEEEDEKENTGITSVHQISDVSGNNANNNSASESNNSSVTDEQRGPVSVCNPRVSSNSHAAMGASHGDISENPVTRTTANYTCKPRQRQGVRGSGGGHGKKTHLLRGVLTPCSMLSVPP